MLTNGLSMPSLTELLTSCPGPFSVEGNASALMITHVTSDSRKVIPGSLFIAVRGTHQDGSAYALDAVAAGAVAVVMEQNVRVVLPPSITRVRVENSRLILAKIAAAFYSVQPQWIAAITGTDGKTSTAEFFRQLWQMSGKKSASIGTLGVIGAPKGVDYPSMHTTPDPVVLHRILQELSKENCQYVALEASSHGLDQRRLDGVRIMAAAFTNLTRDHLDYHRTMGEYFAAKQRLFSDLLNNKGTAVLNADDATFAHLKESCRAKGIQVTSYGLQGEEYRIKKIVPTLEGLAMQADIRGKSKHFMLQLVGEFQAMNVLAALGLYAGCKGDIEEGLQHLPHLHSVPGRLERVAIHSLGAAIFIDYAHTPAALTQTLKTLRPHVHGKLVVVFGCGGDRDKGKRPQMGRAAEALAHEVIITDDNPRGENPALIRSEVQAGAPTAKNIGNRAEAIAYAVKSLHKGDVLLIAGKGHEKTQIIGQQILPFDDAQAAREAVENCKE